MSLDKTFCFGLLLLAASRVFALGLGDAVGTPVVGEALHIEIPLLGSGVETPSPACFKAEPPRGEIGNDFILRNVRIRVVGERGGAKLIATTDYPVREPLVGFAVTAGCNFGLTRDYVLLASLAPAAPAAPVAAPAAPVAAPAVPAVAPPASARTLAAATLRVETDITLDALARQKYPLQPKAREKFVRMLAQANPGLGGGDGVIAAGTDLLLPPGLPRRREGAAAPTAKPAVPTPPPAAAPAPAAPAAKRAAPKQDRLMIGTSPASSEARLLEEAEQLTGLLMEQTKAQDELLANLARLESEYAALRKEFARLESSLARVEAERKAEKESNAFSLDLVVLVVAVLAGGALGGLLLHLYQRRRAAPAVAAAAPARPFAAPSAKPQAPQPSTSRPAPSEQRDVLDFHTKPLE